MRSVIGIGICAVCLNLWADPPRADTNHTDEVVVSAKRLEVENKIDRKVYTISPESLAQFNNMGDVLNIIPSIDVDMDGAVSLRGDSNVLILVDGKPSARFQGAAAGDNLLAMSALEIERIEVLTTPPPEYKSEGVSGVINLITRKHSRHGLAGTLQANVGNDHRSNVNVLSEWTQPWGSISLGLGDREDMRFRHMASNLTPVLGSGTVFSANATVMDETIHRHVPSLNLGVAMNLSEVDTLKVQTGLSHRGGLRTYNQLSQSMDETATVQSQTIRHSKGFDPETDSDALVRYTRSLSEAGASIDTSIHRSQSSQHEQYQYTDDTIVPVASTALSALSFSENHIQTEYALDSVWPLAQSQTLKVGINWQTDQYEFDNEGQTFDASLNQMIVNPVLSDAFKFDQTVLAFYSSYQRPFGALTMLMGLRGEHTDYTGDQITISQNFHRSYSNVFPSMHLDAPVNDVLQWNFGLSRRISRPNPQSLNPFVDTEYTPSLSAGNAHLSPQLTDSLESGIDADLGPLKSSVNLYARRNQDAFTDVIVPLSNGDTLATRENLAVNRSDGIELNVSDKVSSTVNGSVSANAFYSQIDATALGAPGLRSTTGVNLKSKWDWHPDAHHSWQLTVVHNDHRLTPQGMVLANTIVNTGYRQVINPEWSLVVTLSDLSNGQRFIRESNTPTFNQYYERDNRGRVAYVGVLYNFGSNVAKKTDKTNNFEYDSGGS